MSVYTSWTSSKKKSKVAVRPTARRGVTWDLIGGESGVDKFEVGGSYLRDDVLEASHVFPEALEDQVLFQTIQYIINLSGDFAGEEALAAVSAYPGGDIFDLESNAVTLIGKRDPLPIHYSATFRTLATHHC